jgi:hypothetical protein
MVALIGHIEEEGAHFGSQQVRRRGAGGGGHPPECDRGRKVDPGAIGSRETRSGEFCRGMMLFIDYFSRSARTGYEYSYSGLNGPILPSQ